MTEKFKGVPEQMFLEETRESLEDLLREKGVEHALYIAEKAERDINLFIEKDIRAAARQGTTEMRKDWRNELAEWKDKLEEISSFIAEHSGGPASRL